MYSLSSCWNSHRHTDGRAMLREIRDLGFEYAELSHGTRISLLPGILEAIDADEIKISSLHNFCPLPIGVNSSAPNLYQFSAERPRERELVKVGGGGVDPDRERTKVVQARDLYFVRDYC